MAPSYPLLYGGNEKLWALVLIYTRTDVALGMEGNYSGYGLCSCRWCRTVMQMAQNNNSTQLWFNKKNDDMICYECFHINEVEEAKCSAQVAQVIHVKKRQLRSPEDLPSDQRVLWSLHTTEWGEAHRAARPCRRDGRRRPLSQSLSESLQN